MDARGSVRSVKVDAAGVPEPRRANELRIREAAESCWYEPGMLNGERVVVHGVPLRVRYSGWLPAHSDTP